MERMTERNLDVVICNDPNHCAGGIDDCWFCEHFSLMRKRLAEYEDSGLTPEEVETMKNGLIQKPLTLEELKSMNGMPVWWWNTTQKPVCTICVYRGYDKEPRFVNFDFTDEDCTDITPYKKLSRWGYKAYRVCPERQDSETDANH